MLKQAETLWTMTFFYAENKITEMSFFAGKY